MNTLSGLSEGELVSLCQRGESAAAGELFKRHYTTSLRVARRILDSEPDSEDAVQAAYCAAFQHLGSFRGEASFKTWLHRIVANKCLMAMRDPWRRRRVSCAEPTESDFLASFAAPGPSPEKSACSREMASALDRAMFHLPQRLRGAYSLYVLSDSSISEVATALDLTIAAAKSRIFRARGVMRLSLGTVWHEQVWHGKTKRRIRPMQRKELCPTSVSPQTADGDFE
jgi:RNA polymerase sigma-70 factor (ECF subfamily)